MRTTVIRQKNINVQKQYLLSFLEALKYLRPEFGLKTEKIGDLTLKIAKNLNYLTDELYFSAYYANIGLLKIEQYLDNPGVNKKELLIQHVYYSINFCRQILDLPNEIENKVVDIIKNHHELPTGGGYFSTPVRNKNAATIQIAETFIGMTEATKFRPPLALDYSVEQVIEPYAKAHVFEREEIELIRSALYSFYYDEIKPKRNIGYDVE